MLLIIEIAAGVVLGLILFHYLKSEWEEERVNRDIAALYAPGPDCQICGHPERYHKRDDFSGITECTNCSWYETDGPKHGWDERRPYTAENGFMKAGDYSARHYFKQEEKTRK